METDDYEYLRDEIYLLEMQKEIERDYLDDAYPVIVNIKPKSNDNTTPLSGNIEEGV